MMGYKARILAGLIIYTGLGVASISSSSERGSLVGADVSYYTPTAQVRLEYRPQSRVGVSIAAGYDLQTKTATRLFKSIKAARLNKLSFEPSVSLYF